MINPNCCPKKKTPLVPWHPAASPINWQSRCQMLSREDNNLFLSHPRLMGACLSEDNFVIPVSAVLALASTIWPSRGHT